MTIDLDNLYDATIHELNDIGWGSIGIFADSLEDLNNRLNNIEKNTFAILEQWVDRDPQLFSGKIYRNNQLSGKVGGFRYFYKLKDSPFSYLDMEEWFPAWGKWVDTNAFKLKGIIDNSEYDDELKVEEITRISWIACMNWLAHDKKRKPLNTIND